MSFRVMVVSLAASRNKRFRWSVETREWKWRRSHVDIPICGLSIGVMTEQELVLFERHVGLWVCGLRECVDFYRVENQGDLDKVERSSYQ